MALSKDMISEVISSVRADWLDFQETKLREVSEPIIGQPFGFKDVGFLSLSIDFVGGILCVWKSARFSESSRVC